MSTVSFVVHWKYHKTDFITHWRHVLPTYLSAFCLSDEEADRVVFSKDQNERIRYATSSDSWPGHIAVHVLDNLPLSTIWFRRILTMCGHHHLSAYQVQKLGERWSSHVRRSFVEKRAQPQL